jgi:malate dehydrogenase (oxaloacetate-decarboxylating)(NADP+)
VIDGADIFLGCSGPKVLTPEMVKKMARQPMILALANPEPEILPPLAKAVREDAIICTGRSDYPNQVNNVSASRSSSVVRWMLGRRRLTKR